MGNGFLIKCKNCEYEKDIHLGIGMMYSHLENIVDDLKKSEREKIKSVLKKHDIPGFNGGFTNYEHKLYVCKNCGELSDDLHIRIKDLENGKLLYLSKHKCKKCNSLLKNIKEKNLNKCFCPKCKQKTLIQDMSICWD